MLHSKSKQSSNPLIHYKFTHTNLAVLIWSAHLKIFRAIVQPRHNSSTAVCSSLGSAAAAIAAAIAAAAIAAAAAALKSLGTTHSKIQSKLVHQTWHHSSISHQSSSSYANRSSSWCISWCRTDGSLQSPQNIASNSQISWNNTQQNTEQIGAQNMTS